MPEEPGISSETIQPAPPAGPEPGAADDSSGLNPWLLAALLGVAVLVSIQNLWLRRKGEREERAAERRAADQDGP